MKTFKNYSLAAMSIAILASSILFAGAHRSNAAAARLNSGVNSTAMARQSDEERPAGQIQKNGIDIDVRSLGKQISDAIQESDTRPPQFDHGASQPFHLVPLQPDSFTDGRLLPRSQSAVADW